jgi:RNA polymerase sigma-70 factor (ECF subfamily)
MFATAETFRSHASTVRSDRQNLASRVLAGDMRAFREIFDHHGDSVRRFLVDMLRSEEAADEAVQETFVRAHAGLENLRDSERLLGWLLGIARFVAMERLRAQKKDRMHDPIDEAKASSSLVSPSPSPIAQLLKAEADNELKKALDGLAAERRQVMLLRVDHQLGYEEIATIMDWSISKVKNEIHRARLQLRKRLANYTEGLGDE